MNMIIVWLSGKAQVIQVDDNIGDYRIYHEQVDHSLLRFQEYQQGILVYDYWQNIGI